MPVANQPLDVGEETIVRPKIRIGQVAPESAKTYAFLDIEQHGQAPRRIAIKEDAVLIGRADPKSGIKPQIDLAPFDSSTKVSRQHARIRVEGNSFSVEDLNSRNKTRLGDTILAPMQPASLQDGDVISFGPVKATFHLLGTSALPVPWSQS
jgi:pSer/pThr/pTyr-binding forkhead associated (FHA) protein